MSRMPRGSTGPPNPLDVLRGDLVRIYLWLYRQITLLADWIFDITRLGAQRRRTFFIAAAILGWSALALFTHAVRWSLWRDIPAAIPLDFLRAYTAPNVLRHIIPTLVAFWLALRIAAIYLDDIFELTDVSVAERFIRQAAFGAQYNMISIQEGDIAPASRNSPLYRIGGPGLVLIHLENAALFEKIDGQPDIVGPERGSHLLESFERLREVIDLRDQVMDVTVTARSQDGIHVTAKDVRLIFSVYRGSEDEGRRQRLMQPYTYTKKAIRNLVYRRANGKWTDAMRRIIRAEMRRFIGRHQLTEFLAAASPADGAAFDASRRDAERESGYSERIHVEGESPDLARPAQFDNRRFISRDQLAELFYRFTDRFSKDAEARGVELKWIGIGTWETPSEIIPEQHLKAWQLSCQNQLDGSPRAIRELQNESRREELLRLIREIPVGAFQQLESRGLPLDQIKRELLLSYREKLRIAWEYYQSNQEQPPAELEATLRHINWLTAHRL